MGGEPENGGAMPNAQGEIAKIIPYRDSNRRVVIVKRSDGFYSVQPERWYANIWEDRVVWQGWIPVGYRSGIIDTIEAAEREARQGYVGDDYQGMTTNERLFVAGMLEQFDSSVRIGDRAAMIRALVAVEIGHLQAEQIADNILAHPTRYGRI